MEYEFQRNRIDKIPPEKIKEELLRVAKLYDYFEFGYREFDEVSTLCKSNTVKKTFGSWSEALASLDPPLKKRSKRKFSDTQLFEEMDRIWKKLGHRPSRTEWENCNTKISYNTYKRIFGGWKAACLKFIEYKMGGEIEIYEPPKINKITNNKTEPPSNENKRTIPLGLRIKILERDSFRCVYCGRSPATDLNVKLHIDHIDPFSKGGKTEFENLQTLCGECNLGKSNKQISV